MAFATYWLICYPQQGQAVSSVRLWLQNLFVVVASYVFYGWWKWEFLILITITALWAWASGLLLSNLSGERKRKLVVAAALVVNLGILGTFKYCNFFVESAVRLLDMFGMSVHMSALNVILPVGISFYTFQALSYVIDVFPEKRNFEIHNLFCDSLDRGSQHLASSIIHLFPILTMKKFIFRLSLAICPFAFAFGILLRIVYQSELDVLKHDLTCPINILAAVVGDSRVETYFDPEEMPWLRNFGQSATPFPVSAHKAKLIAELNPHLKLIVIDIWPYQFFSDIDKPYGPSVPNGIALIEMMTREGMAPLGDGFDVRVAKGVLFPGLENLMAKGRRKGQITGGFMKNHKFIKEGHFCVECAHMIPFWPKKTPIELPLVTPTGCEIVLECLLRDLSHKNINVILTTTPLLWYGPRYTKEAREYFERRMAEIASRHGVHWYNWMNDYQSNTNYWADVNHLNDIGARIFSRDKRIILEQYLK